MMEMTSEPRQPARFEKKANIILASKRGSVPGPCFGSARKTKPAGADIANLLQKENTNHES